MVNGVAEQVDVVVIGAGQAGLSAGYHLRRRGFQPQIADAVASYQFDPADTPWSARRRVTTARSFIMLDADSAPGGAWQHRWASLLMGTVNGIYQLPGSPVPTVDPHAPAREVLPPYFAEYERTHDLQVQRPWRVMSVKPMDSNPHGRLDVQAVAPDGRRKKWAARYVINATGTWNQPFIPVYPGQETFTGRQLHVAEYVAAQEFAGLRVGIVGAGVSAVQLLNEISYEATTFWFTRDEPVWVEGEFDEAARLAAIDGVADRTRQGIPPFSVVDATGMYWSPWAREAYDRGVLVRHPMFTRIEPRGVRLADGEFQELDVILWATGFRPAIRHLSPWGLRTPAGGIRADEGRALDDPRLFLIGYGPSQSTVGANRAGWAAVRAIFQEIDARV